jgi:hypothetical protein
MPYNSVRSEVLSRFLEVNHLLNSIKSIEDSIIAPAVAPLEYKIYKGFFYVHIYACIEFSINKLVVTTLTLARSKNILYRHIENKFYTIALSSNLQSIRDCNPKTFLDKTADLFLAIDSGDISHFDETFVSKYLQNVWGKTFNQITKTLGMNNFGISGNKVFAFDEIVDNRNKMAHGRDSAADIGSAPNYPDLKNRYDLIFDTINRYINHFEAYYANKEFIKISDRVNY